MSENSLSADEIILASALRSYEEGIAHPLVGPSTVEYSERCVETPWVAAMLRSPGRILDIGWSMSPPEWLGLLLRIRSDGANLTGIDIVDPQRVSSRYPVGMREQVLEVEVRVENFLDAQPTHGTFDTITCVSTLEHIGFDVASEPENKDTAFIRADSPEGAQSQRDPSTDAQFLDAVARLLRPGGILLLSVPAGPGIPILHQDSLGLFTYQFEYGESDWKALINDPRFELIDQALYGHDPLNGWSEAENFDQLTKRTSEMLPFATGCAVASLRLL